LGTKARGPIDFDDEELYARPVLPTPRKQQRQPKNQQAGVKGWPPVDWDMRSSQSYHSWIHLDGRVKYVSLEATHQKHPQRQPPTSNNTMVDSKISESAFQIETAF
jgi:hypothetical protein